MIATTLVTALKANTQKARDRIGQTPLDDERQAGQDAADAEWEGDHPGDVEAGLALRLNDVVKLKESQVVANSPIVVLIRTIHL